MSGPKIQRAEAVGPAPMHQAQQRRQAIDISPACRRFRTSPNFAPNHPKTPSPLLALSPPPASQSGGRPPHYIPSNQTVSIHTVSSALRRLLPLQSESMDTHPQRQIKQGDQRRRRLMPTALRPADRRPDKNEHRQKHHQPHHHQQHFPTFFSRHERKQAQSRITEPKDDEQGQHVGSGRHRTGTKGIGHPNVKKHGIHGKKHGSQSQDGKTPRRGQIASTRRLL